MHHLHSTVTLTVLLFILGLVTGFIGTNTGGSAFLTVPIMMWLGIPPQSAVATARVASVGTMLAGIRAFHQHKKIDYRLAMPAAALGLMGSVLGAMLLVKVNTALLHKVIGGLTLTMVVMSLLKKPSAQMESVSKMRMTLGYLAFIVIGMVGGFFGGQAKLATYVFILVFGKSASESIGTRKVSGLVISLGALVIYGMHGIIRWGFGSVLVAGTIIGSTVGSRYALKKGDAWMERLLNVVVILLALRLILLPI